MRVHDLHPWDVAPAEARQIQRDLADRVSLDDVIRLEDVRLVAGVDNGYSGRGLGATAYAAVVVLTFPNLEVVETQVATATVTFPYVPGLLSFREAPAMLAALQLVESDPDVVLFDAQGYAHPRRMGAASHLGLFIDRPSIGCAKSRLIGQYDEPGERIGDRQPLRDRDEVIGTVLRTRTGHKPLFISPGHKVSVETAAEIVLACCRDNRFTPEPTRLADRLVREAKSSATSGLS